jgi:hypothetical protein
MYSGLKTQTHDRESEAARYFFCTLTCTLNNPYQFSRVQVRVLKGFHIMIII